MSEWERLREAWEWDGAQDGAWGDVFPSEWLYREAEDDLRDAGFAPSDWPMLRERLVHVYRMAEAAAVADGYR